MSSLPSGFLSSPLSSFTVEKGSKMKLTSKLPAENDDKGDDKKPDGKDDISWSKGKTYG
jgi:hypothetical protein